MPATDAAVALHVTNGDSVVDTLCQTSLGGSLLSWADVLTEGPVPQVAAGELHEIRAGFLSDAGWGSASEIVAEFERRDGILLQALAEGTVVLWFEHDLFDQLQLLQILALAANADSADLELINVGSFPGREQFFGLGELDERELQTLWPLRRPVTDEIAEGALSAWNAFRSLEPTGVQRLLRADFTGLPFLNAAFARLLEELPDAATGLSRSERHVLQVLSAGAATPTEVFLACQRLEAAPFDGDTWAWRRLAGLAAGKRPLVATVAGSELPVPPPLGDGPAFTSTAVCLTEDGRAVLDGAADRVELMGLDRWLGGTHLRRDNAWRWDAESRSVLPP